MSKASPPSSAEPVTCPPAFSRQARLLVLTAAFLGWAFSGMQMAVLSLCARSAAQDFVAEGQVSSAALFRWERILFAAPPRAQALDAAEMRSEVQQVAPRWIAWFNAAFLLGAAAGGWALGGLGDSLGRARSMSLSIGVYSLCAGLGYWAATPEQLLLTRFLSGLGVGGMWPTGVALVSEAWSDGSRPMIAGVLGAAANVGIVLMNVLALIHPVAPGDWRWALLAAATPLVLGVVSWFVTPESPAWLATRGGGGKRPEGASLLAVFRPPLLSLTLIGIAVGTVPLVGGWGATQWLIFWADKVGGLSDPRAKAYTAIMRAGGGAIGSLLGGWIANLLGRRITYFLISLTSLALGEYLCLAITPKDASFLGFVFALGFVSTIFFGWLPLYLPELFPTHARATGAGVSFNFGRILTAGCVLGAGALTAYLNEDYGRAGAWSMLVYGVGMVVILFAPDTTKKSLAS